MKTIPNDDIRTVLLENGVPYLKSSSPVFLRRSQMDAVEKLSKSEDSNLFGIDWKDVYSRARKASWE